MPEMVSFTQVCLEMANQTSYVPLPVISEVQEAIGYVLLSLNVLHSILTIDTKQGFVKFQFDDLIKPEVMVWRI